MAAGLDGEGQRRVDLGPRPVRVSRKFSEACRDIDRRKSLGGAPDVRLPRQNEARKLGENRLFAAQRLIGGGGFLTSSSARSAVEKRIAPAMVWR